MENDEQIELLIMLHDLDLMLKEATVNGSASSRSMSSEESLGFKIDRTEGLRTARQDIVSQLDDELLQRYERLNQKHGRAIVPVINGVCYGCFMRLPTAVATESGKKVLTCENCGRFLYWVRQSP